jgi:cytoskeletal protein CcmA (bactofilin family)
MKTKQPQTEVSGAPEMQRSGTSVTQFRGTAMPRASCPMAHERACLGSSLQIKGAITGTEDLQIDGKVLGPISLQGHELTVGPTAELKSEIAAREVVVFGRVTGNLFARDRVEIKKDGAVTGDISTARITIEDGAIFKGRIEIDPAKSQTTPEMENTGIREATEVS